MITQYLRHIKSPQDLKGLDLYELKILAQEIREFLLEKISKTGGHLSSNLGSVELILAMHYVFESPKDKLIFDVGHQAYTHKILTGRQDGFDTLRQKDGLSGYLKRSESEHDHFGAGHATTSLSAASGFAFARDLLGEDSHVVAMIGDGSLTGGMAYEALNYIGEASQKMIIVINDNEMSIAKNVGAMQKNLMELRTFRGYNRIKGFMKENINEKASRTLSEAKKSLRHALLPTTIFDDLGMKYYGPVDGHNLESLIDYFERLKDMDQPVVLHAMTKKGKGYPQAEYAPDNYHGVGVFNVLDGLKTSGTLDYSALFGKSLLEMAKEDPRVVAITAAMPGGTGLTPFQEALPGQFIDVGIAEENAVTMAAGLALGGLKPYLAVYSTFLQRGFDQVIHDVCIQGAPVTFCIDRAGLVGNDGETHQGLFDVGYLSLIPGMSIMAPKDGHELKRMLRYSVDFNGPLAIRYPRDSVVEINEDQSDLTLPELFSKGAKTLLVGYSRIVNILLSLQQDHQVDVLNHRMIWPLNKEYLAGLFDSYEHVFVIEEHHEIGGLSYHLKKAFPFIHTRSIPMEFVQQQTIPEGLLHYGLDKESIETWIAEIHEETTS